MAVPVLFYRGPKSSYDVSQHGNGIYFCTDTYEIFMNNHSYGGGKVQDVTLNSTSNCLTIHYTSGDTTDVALAKASEVLDGLMSKEDKVKLDSLSGNYSSSLSSTVSTVEKLGGIAAGTTVAQLTGKSYNEIFDTLIFPTVNPTFTNPSASISLKSYSNIQEIGAVAPSTANFNDCRKRTTCWCYWSSYYSTRKQSRYCFTKCYCKWF